MYVDVYINRIMLVFIFNMIIHVNTQIGLLCVIHNTTVFYNYNPVLSWKLYYCVKNSNPFLGSSRLRE